MTVIVTRDVADRYHGYLASIMPEAAPGVYVAAELSKGVRERIWGLIEDWWRSLPGGSIVLLWKDDTGASRLGLKSLGLPPRELIDLDGALIVRRR
ncbi:type I-E CRISPR-associated endoribonuclease Cas2e [Hansschlegelia beijingensis]